MTKTPDFLVIGGGIMGLAMALELKRRYSDCTLTLIEKEASCGFHASGRNSGVLHAGFYYPSDSLKARFARDGNRRLTGYCEERGLALNRCGKLVVTRSEHDLVALDQLFVRGRDNGVRIEEVSQRRVAEIEPRARTFQRALFSPDTATVDPGSVVASLQADLEATGATVLTSVAYVRRTGKTVSTSAGSYQPGYLVNAAGLYADRIAHDFGFGRNYSIVPFKGLYLVGAPTQQLRTNVYPVPDLDMPFLGVHFTIPPSGVVKLGPTALPAVWREHYRGWDNFSLSEASAIAATQARLFLGNRSGYRRHARSELGKLSRRRLLGIASQLVPDVAGSAGWRWGRPAIRAQLYSTVSNQLEMDFVFEADAASMHVLNAVSPAFTSAFPFSEHLVDRIAELA